MKTMKQHFSDIVTTWLINAIAITGVKLLEIETTMKILVLLATLVYTIIKIYNALKRRKNKEEV